jgi:hypothetical protein
MLWHRMKSGQQNGWPHATREIVILILVIQCLGSVVAQSRQLVTRYDNSSELIRIVLKEAHISGSIEYSGSCGPHHPRIARPPHVRSPRTSGSPVEILRDMFASYPRINVTQNPAEMIRIVEVGVPTDILNVKIHHLSFDDSSGESGPWGLLLRGPNLALGDIFSTPEVQAFSKAHKIDPNHFITPGNALDSGQPIISGQLRDVTVSQALDYILKTAPGYWVYENCTTEDGGRETYFWFY